MVIIEGSFEDSIVTSLDDNTSVITYKTKEAQPKPQIQNSPTTINEIQEKAEIIDIKYINYYPDWIKIIISLKCDNENNRDTALYLTKKSHHFQEESYFNKIWDNCNKSKYKYSIGTFNYYAKLSNPNKYIEINSKYKYDFIEDVIKSSTQEITAKLSPIIWR
jgi:hypothetical protein